ncbi:uncharacterized protein L201_001487 [Kwoniella dendrophila CBS 6074]|uniref:Ricin B lectin domain-containing protein n=1 Tax=Kwoniella dendrophila CBS 6074 TaxID=1295534 RepID=A0AAX4JPY0_9TREE
MLSIILILATFILSVTSSPLEKRYTGVRIQSYRDGKCLSPASTNFANDVQVISVNCSQALRWNINPGSGSIILQQNTNFVLDAGTGTDNNEIVKLWQSYPTLFQQTWYLTTDQRIAITGGNQCLDEGPNRPQTYQCYTGNTNQIWNILQGNNLGTTPIPLPTPSAQPTGCDDELSRR